MTSETIVAGVAACRGRRGLYIKYEQHSSAAQAFDMGPSMGSRGGPPAMTNTAVDHMACNTEVWGASLRAPLAFFLGVANALTEQFPTENVLHSSAVQNFNMDKV